jgi:hypothetical protein
MCRATIIGVWLIKHINVNTGAELSTDHYEAQKHSYNFTKLCQSLYWHTGAEAEKRKIEAEEITYLDMVLDKAFKNM